MTSPMTLSMMFYVTHWTSTRWSRPVITSSMTSLAPLSPSPRRQAFDDIGFDTQEVEGVLGVVASILALGKPDGSQLQVLTPASQSEAPV